MIQTDSGFYIRYSIETKHTVVLAASVFTLQVQIVVLSIVLGAPFEDTVAPGGGSLEEVRSRDQRYGPTNFEL